MSTGQRGSSLFFIVGAIIFAFSVGFLVGGGLQKEQYVAGLVNIEQGKPGAVDFSMFWDAWRVLQEKYADADSLDLQAMVHGAISGMVKSVGDPYTVFMDPKDTRKFMEDIEGTFEGVGMEIGIRDGLLKVIAPLEQTPAQRAGLRAGDAIYEIDGATTRDMTVDKAVSLIRGPKGSTVTFTVFRDGWSDTREFTIERGVIEVPSLRWELKEGNVAYVRLFHFSKKASADFRKAASEILASSADRIVLDLRNNPGGYLEVSQEIAGWFLEPGALVTIEDFGSQEKKREYRAQGNGRLASYPIVVLMNEGSASASEILAGALRDNRGALLIGTQSFGKGSVQELDRLRNGASLKVTVANWLTPNGHHITGIGLEPDIQLNLTAEDFEKNLDPQLDKALEVVKDV
ncbi:MAG: S41 family peptidase [Candidatus Yanofskybacteria bacterium]|nr:S41 family peptidase [Candidatus Yanofskybacteria bacterium]